jgi:hypothetical protein
MFTLMMEDCFRKGTKKEGVLAGHPLHYFKVQYSS